jgi:hypothetical protein
MSNLLDYLVEVVRTIAFKWVLNGISLPAETDTDQHILTPLGRSA